MNQKPDTEFDKLINAAKLKISYNRGGNLQFHRRHSRRDRSMDAPLPWGASFGLEDTAPKPLLSGFADLFQQSAGNRHELAGPKFVNEPPPNSSNSSSGKKQLESLGNKRWRYQGKTYKEEPIGRG